MNYEVDLHYDDDRHRQREGHGGLRLLRRPGRRARARSAARWSGRARRPTRTSRPVLVEIMIEREGNTANGTSIAAIKEFEPLP